MKKPVHFNKIIVILHTKRKRYFSIQSDQFSLKRKHRESLDSVFQLLKLKSWEDWYKVPQKEFKQHLNGIIQFHGNSHIKLLINSYPEYNWKIWKFNKVPSSYWNELKNQRHFFDDLGKELGYEKQEDWYKIQKVNIEMSGGRGILSIYHGSPSSALKKIYPEYEWEFSKFHHLPRRLWENVHHNRKLLDRIGLDLGISQYHEWYNISAHDLDIYETGSSIQGIFKAHGGSLAKALMVIYPEYQWKLWKFKKYPVSSQFWEDIKNQRDFMDCLGKDLMYDTWEDWYKIESADVLVSGGSGLLNRYKESVSKLVTSIYKQEFHWQLYKFKVIPQGYWDDKSNVIAALENTKKELQIKQDSDWYRIKYVQLIDLGLGSLLKKYCGIIPLLSTFYPKYNWNNYHFQPHSKVQQQLFVVIQEFFTDVDIHQEYLPESLKYSETDKKMELDFFIPNLNLAFEYQGEQHYENKQVFASVESSQKRDKEKRDACKNIGITLIEIPYWWDLSMESLAVVICKRRPDLIHYFNERFPNLEAKKEVIEFNNKKTIKSQAGSRVN